MPFGRRLLLSPEILQITVYCFNFGGSSSEYKDRSLFCVFPSFAATDGPYFLLVLIPDWSLFSVPDSGRTFRIPVLLRSGFTGFSVTVRICSQAFSYLFAGAGYIPFQTKMMQSVGSQVSFDLEYISGKPIATMVRHYMDHDELSSGHQSDIYD